jgi:hypothetical protein
MTLIRLRTSSIVGLIALSVVLIGHRAPAAADVLCKRKSGNLALREACKPKEVALPISIEEDGTLVVVKGANLQVIDGSGGTGGVTNGLGNLIVGYNEEYAQGERDHSGSHNLVIGDDHTYSSYGSIVAGEGNSVTAPSSAILAGHNNSVSGLRGAVLGGDSNNVTGTNATISGGVENGADGGDSSIAGGSENFAIGVSSSIGGGVQNSATGDYAMVTGGAGNVAAGELSVVLGGNGNTASGMFDIVP